MFSDILIESVVFLGIFIESVVFGVWMQPDAVARSARAFRDGAVLTARAWPDLRGAHAQHHRRPAARGAAAQGTQHVLPNWTG